MFSYKSLSFLAGDMMKIMFKRIFILLFALIIVIVTISSIFAETIYYDNGIYYTYITNELVSVYGIEQGKAEISIPDIINTRLVVDIRNHAFNDNHEITSLDISRAVYLERIGSFAFNDCVNLDSDISFPLSITTIEDGAFQRCSSIKNVTYNGNINEVSNQCFNGCTSLKNVVLNESITRIGYYAFADCPNLSYLEIPSSVTNIANTAFLNDNITLGVYSDSYAHQYAENKGIPYIVIDSSTEPTEPPTEPEPTEVPTEVPTEEPTVLATEAPTQADTEAPTELIGYYLGDVNGDGTVDTIDTTLLQRHLASISILSEYNILHGDVDSDGITSIIDVTLIGRYLAKIDVIYPVGKWQSTI